MRPARVRACARVMGSYWETVLVSQIRLPRPPGCCWWRAALARRATGAPHSGRTFSRGGWRARGRSGLPWSLRGMNNCSVYE